jgi:hypothetical protein
MVVPLNSISSFEPVPQKSTIEMSEGLKVKMKRAGERLRLLYNGIDRGAYPLIERFHCEVFDRRHRYCKELSLFFAIWKKSTTKDDFDTWMHELDLGQDVSGKDALRDAQLLGTDDKPIGIPSVRYLTPTELIDYEALVDSQGRIYSKNNDNMPFHSADSTKDNGYIFIINPDDKIYIGRYSRGDFGHSSFGGGAVKSAGTLIFDNGKLTAIWDDSGHYNSEAYRSGNYGYIKEKMLYALNTFKKQGIDTSDTEIFLTECVGTEKVIKRIKGNEMSHDVNTNLSSDIRNMAS